MADLEDDLAAERERNDDLVVQLERSGMTMAGYAARLDEAETERTESVDLQVGAGIGVEEMADVGEEREGEAREGVGGEWGRRPDTKSVDMDIDLDATAEEEEDSGVGGERDEQNEGEQDVFTRRAAHPGEDRGSSSGSSGSSDSMSASRREQRYRQQLQQLQQHNARQQQRPPSDEETWGGGVFNQGEQEPAVVAQRVELLDSDEEQGTPRFEVGVGEGGGVWAEGDWAEGDRGEVDGGLGRSEQLGQDEEEEEEEDELAEIDEGERRSREALGLGFVGELGLGGGHARDAGRSAR